MRHGTNAVPVRQASDSPSYFSVARAMGAESKDLADFRIPCNPYFPTTDMFEQLAEDLPTILKYYPSDAATVTGQLASVLGLNPSTISMSNGSTELITWIDHLLISSSVAVPIPTFGRWTDQPMETGKRVDMFLLREADNFELRVDDYLEFIRQRGSRVAVLCNPNNPDGGYLPRREVIRFMDALADLDLVIIDESFIDFVELERNPSVMLEATVRPNVVVLRSMGKNFGLHGIRFGYVVANPALIRKIGGALPKWNLNSLAETIVFMLAEYWDSYEESLKLLARDRFAMSSELGRFHELTVFSSQANFMLVKLPPGVDGALLGDYLLNEHHLLIRDCGNNIGMTGQFVRLGVRPEDEVERLVEGLRGFARSRNAEPARPVELIVRNESRARSLS